MKRRDTMRRSVLSLLLTQFACLAYGDWPMRTADSEEFPFQVTVLDLRKDNYLCSGVLITNRTVLTPASCVQSDNLLKISAGSIHRKQQNRTTNYRAVIIHPGFNRTDTTNDLALIRVSDPFKLDEHVTPARIPLKGTELVNRTSFSGWSVLDPDDSLKVYENYTLWRDCRLRYNLARDIGPDEFCGDYVLGPDHGSPISKNGVVYGLETYSLMDMHSFVELSYHSDWIKKNLGMEAYEVKWHGANRNEARSPSNCMAAMLLFAVFLCQ